MSEETIETPVDLPVKEDSETPEAVNTGALETSDPSFSGNVTIVEE